MTRTRHHRKSRIEIDYDGSPEDFARGLYAVLERTGTAGPTALVLGSWDEDSEGKLPLQLLIERDQLMSCLRSLFVGGRPDEECWISWIMQEDQTPLLAIQSLIHGALIEPVVQA